MDFNAIGAAIALVCFGGAVLLLLYLILSAT
jgi:hypothetical protein